MGSTTDAVGIGIFATPGFTPILATGGGMGTIVGCMVTPADVTSLDNPSASCPNYLGAGASAGGGAFSSSLFNVLPVG